MTNYSGQTLNYTASDISAVTIDMLVGIGATLVSFVSVIALIMLYNWLKGQKIRFG